MVIKLFINFILKQKQKPQRCYVGGQILQMTLSDGLYGYSSKATEQRDVYVKSLSVSATTVHIWSC